MKKTALLALLLIAKAVANQTDQKTTTTTDQRQPQRADHTLIRIECVNGRWKITHLVSTEVAQITKAKELEGKPCN